MHGASLFLVTAAAGVTPNTFSVCGGPVTAYTLKYLLACTLFQAV